MRDIRKSGQQAMKQKLVGCKVVGGSKHVPLYAEGMDGRNWCSCSLELELQVTGLVLGWCWVALFLPKGRCLLSSPTRPVLNWMKW